MSCSIIASTRRPLASPHPLAAVSMRTPTEKRTGLPRLSGWPLSKETTSAPRAPPVGFTTRKESLCHDRCRTRKGNRQGAEAQRAAPRASARPATGARAAWRAHEARGADYLFEFGIDHGKG